MAPAKAAFSSVIDILTTIRVSDLLAFSHVGHRLKYAQDCLIDQVDCVCLGFVCAEVCTTLDLPLREKGLDNLNKLVCEAVRQLTL